MHINHFAELTDDALLMCYRQLQELGRIGSIGTQPLRGILDRYCAEYPPAGIHMMEVDLLGEIAGRWAAGQEEAAITSKEV